MSSQPQQPAPTAPKDSKEKKGFGRFISRAKTVLKRGEGSSSKRRSVLATRDDNAAKAEAAKKRYVV